MISSFRHVSYLKDFIDKDNLIYNTLEDNLNRRVNSFQQPQAGQFALFFMTMKHYDQPPIFQLLKRLKLSLNTKNLSIFHTAKPPLCTRTHTLIIISYNKLYLLELL
jgi:hypothetical protein